jgi:hypothetical protein
MFVTGLIAFAVAEGHQPDPLVRGDLPRLGASARAAR